jgi:hypothetical protein
MQKKETGSLKTLGDSSFNEKKIVLNPNDGFDLDFIMLEVTAMVYLGESLDILEDDQAKPEYVRFYQENKCRLGTVELSLKTMERLGNPKYVRLHSVPNNPYPKVLIEPL